MMRLAALLLTVGLVSLAAQDLHPMERCQTLGHHGQKREAQECFAALLGSGPFLRAEGFRGLGRFDEANEAFRGAHQANPSAIVKTEWGRLYLDHYQPADAAKLFEEAIAADVNYTPAYLGLARVYSQRFDKRSVDLAREAAKRSPSWAEPHELLAYLALEDNDEKATIEEAQKAIGLSAEALDAMAVLASIDWLKEKQHSDWMDRILKVNPIYGEAYVTGAHFLEINYRYSDAIPFYRKALALNGDLLQARAKLGVDLMRLGQHAEARQQLEKCYADHYRDAQTVNSLKLLDSLAAFRSFKTPQTEIILNKNEAALLHPYVQDELERAMATYGRKYEMKLTQPVRVEVFPNHEDFAVRTLGLPDQGGLLGVTFATVVAMDSPSARAPGAFNWGSTLWHEMSHVYVLTATRNVVPRWFTEGLAVHEEGAAAPEWRDRLTPEVVAALQKRKIVPVLDLDKSFVRPDYPGQVIVSYFQAGQICDYIAERWSDRALLGIIHSYAERKSTSEALSGNLHETTEAFDKEFAAWLDKKIGPTLRNFDEWKRNIKAGYASLAAGRADEAIQLGLANAGRYPTYAGDHSNFDLLAQAYLKKGDKTAAMNQLESYRDHGGSDPQTLDSLARLESENGRPAQAENTLNKLNFIYPENEDAHRQLARLALLNGNTKIAIRESEAVIALRPADAAQSHFELAKALQAAKRPAEAKDQVILALEAAPDYKPAQQLLLQLSQ